MTPLETLRAVIARRIAEGSPVVTEIAVRTETDVNGHPVVNMGDTLTCTETGKTFVAARDGCSVNYAWTRDGAILSDEGVDIRERRELLERKPFGCYLSSDGRTVTGWKGNRLGHVTSESTSRTGWHGSDIVYIRVTDCHGALWYGKGAGRGMCITIRPAKS